MCSTTPQRAASVSGRARGLWRPPWITVSHWSLTAVLKQLSQRLSHAGQHFTAVACAFYGAHQHTRQRRAACARLHVIDGQPMHTSRTASARTSLMKDPLRQEQAPSTRRRPSLSETAPCAAARRSRESTCAAHTSLQGRLHGHWQSVPLRGTQRHSVAPRGYQPAPLSCHSAPNHTCD